MGIVMKFLKNVLMVIGNKAFYRDSKEAENTNQLMIIPDTPGMSEL